MIKNFITFGVKKNILNHIFFIFLVILSLFAYNKIPKEIFPPSNLDAISITGAYVGTSPDVLDKLIVQELEDDISNLNDIDRIESSIRNGAFTISIYLKGGSNKDAMLVDVKDIISAKRKDLPLDMDEPIARIMTTNYPLVAIAISSDKDIQEILEVANQLKSALSKIQDLSDIFIRGDADQELLIKINEKKIQAYGFATQNVFSSIASLSEVFPVGIIKERGKHLFVSTKGGEGDIQKLQNTRLVILGKSVMLKDIADVSFGLADLSEVSHFNGKTNISVNINKGKNGNAIALVKEVKQLLKEFEAKYAGFSLQTYSDTSIWIRNRLNTVISNIIFGLILVSFSVYIFINSRIAFVVGVGIPVSFMIGLIAAQLLGYSLNMLSLLGALIALGMLVDEAIVVAENIYRHLEEGESPREAAINGAYEVFPAVLTATATTIFAFLPLLIMSGEMGVFMRILPIMISILLLSSLFEAFFFLPLHAKDFLTTKKNTLKNQAFWSFMNVLYAKHLGYVLRYKKTFLISFLLFSFVSITTMFKSLDFQLFPNFDTTEIHISGKVDVNYELLDTQKIISEVEQVLLENLPKNQISSVASISGFMLDAKYKAHLADNNFHIFINLHERASENFFDSYINPYLSFDYDDSDMIRTKSALEILDEIKKLTERFNKDERFEEFKAVVPGAGIVSSDVDIAFSSEDPKLVQKAVQEITAAMQKVQGVYNIEDDLKPGKKELKLQVNTYGQMLGFNEATISSMLRPYFFKAEAAKMFYNGEIIKIRTQEKMKDTFNAIASFVISVPFDDKKVRLSEVVDFEFVDGYSDIYKDASKRVSSVFASLDKKKVTSTQLFKVIDPKLQELKKMGIFIDIKGEQKEGDKVKKEMSIAATIAGFLIFLTLVWMFDSLLLSCIILTTIPLALFGVFGGHLLMGINLTMPALLGIVGLCGVVVNDGIIMMDFLKKSKTQSDVLEFASMRLRPILLTSITTVLGLSTLMFFATGQAVILQPMALALGFGIAWATVLNLFYIPLIFTLIKLRGMHG
ncbi:MAG: efflux RND transporter permease subunit [Sulfurospirillum sp.]|nr:efflux RND transporter permease subunit [Sulfurospirillum sp.]